MLFHSSSLNAYLLVCYSLEYFCVLSNTTQPADFKFACLRPMLPFYSKPKSPFYQKGLLKRSLLLGVLEMNHKKLQLLHESAKKKNRCFGTCKPAISFH